MKKLILALAMGGAVAASAAPAMAQSYYSTAYSAIQAREDRLGERIDQALSDGDITLAQADRLRDDLRRIERLDRNYRWDGLTLTERQDLVSELNGLESSLRYSMSDRSDSELDFGYGYYR
jgi:hypothetical protein